ncbi:dihydrolipoamide acetyltransferase family protein [Chelativorans salis]|uniref:Dihydrolipoamide acetyltransferase component of pyruvate dehydrogenase complex n=1 Tax=Chelativorans salis TaxID=2978478 RepID=A0ABT2LT26_9HYPH|nr:dihydrolipoamide acetyltransferase family protein [Chelativorans sp. EGI FJ00035]MCT7377695.1 2-oxo acid dehydrogenase subunit E2 [Chelativorans sp. EGI FJ00035]
MDVVMPQLGETVSEGTISTWFKAEGDAVAEGDVLFEIETDKVSMEVQAVGAGVLRKIHVGAGATAPVGAVVAVIAGKAEPASKGDVTAATANPRAGETMPAGSPAPAPVPVPRMNGHGGLDLFFEVRTPERNYGKAEAANGVKITPLARRLIAEAGLDAVTMAEEAARQGKRRVVKADVEAARARAPAAPVETRQPRPAQGQAEIGPEVDVVPLNRIRKRSAEHLSEAWRTVPHVVQAVEADFTRLDKMRRKANEENAERWDFRLSYLPFIARATCLAIRDYPQVNARLDGERLLVARRVHLGIAVDLDHDGLVVPVVRGADDLTLVGLARAINEAVARARAGKLTADDLSGATYSISNSGTFGTMFTAPIVNAPQVAILSTDGVRKKPVVVSDEDGDRIGVGLIGILAQSFDHRAFDGAYSAAFLARLRTIIETRDWSQEI